MDGFVAKFARISRERAANIDPHFKDVRVLGPNSDDDHPPSDLLAGQDLVLTIYHALSASPAWPRTPGTPRGRRRASRRPWQKGAHPPS